MYIADPDTGDRIWIENIRLIQIRFDAVEKDSYEYIFLNEDGDPVGSVVRSHLDVKTRSKLDSLAEY